MASYDPRIIQTFADDLYSRATAIVVLSVLLFGLVGGITGYVVFRGLGPVILAAIGAAAGYYLGSQRAFLLKLRAQMALCQIEIEKNTREALSLREGSLPMTTAIDEVGKRREPILHQDNLLGRCPNCTRTIPLTSTECPRCKALFGEGSAWKVRPL